MLSTTSRSVAVAVLLAAAACPTAGGQEIQPVFRAQMALARAEILQGRIVCRLDRLTRWGNTISRSPGGSESLRFDQGDRGTSMHYQLRAATRRITIDAWQNEVTMERVLLRDGQVIATTRFEQRPDTPLVLVVSEGDAERRLEADSIWHFWLADSKTCAENLLPLCEMLGLELPWLQFTEALELKLLRLAEASQPRNSADWQRWIDLLGDERFAVREDADRRLRGVGASLVPFVRRVDPDDLDAEQRFRLRRILHDLETALASDTVDSTAEWLVDDPSAWIELLDRTDVANRTTAAAQLGRLLDAEIDFTPAAEEPVRSEQTARLRERIRGLLDRH